MVDPFHHRSSSSKSSDDELQIPRAKMRNRRAAMMRHSNSSLSLRDVSVRHSPAFASTRMLQIAPNDGSDSSLNTEELGPVASKLKSNVGTASANNSSSFLQSSSSSIVDGSKMRKTQRPGRISELRREMSQTRLQKAHSSANSVAGPGGSGDERSINPTHLLRSPTNRRSRKRLASIVSKAPSKSDDGTSTVVETTWKRNSRKPPTCSTSSNKSEAVSKNDHLQSERKKRGLRNGGAMRNVLRNKHRLERELHRSDIFHFVLHKQPVLGNGNHPITNDQSTDSDNEKNRRRSRMSLDKFLCMKHKSELLASNHEKKSHHTKESDTWRLVSDLSRSTADSHLISNDDGVDEGAFHEEDDDNQGSVHSLDFWEAIKDQKESKLISHESGSTAMSEELDSQTLSLDELHLDDDTSRHTVESVTNYAVVDPAGNKGIYSGKISKTSCMPCGHGRLEYPDTGLIYEGQFAHGYWTGYGRCINTRTGEDYTGTFLDNIRHGHGITKYKDGRVFEGSYTHGVKTEGKMMYQDGSTYLGHWSNGARHGRGTYTFANGSVYIGEFENDQMHGSGVLTWSNGTRYVGSWKNGRRHGLGKEFRPNGAVNREGTWNEGSFVRR